MTEIWTRSTGFPSNSNEPPSDSNNSGSSLTIENTQRHSRHDRCCEQSGGPNRLMPTAKKVRCFNCHRLGHISRQCALPPVTLCYNCKQVGHKATNCQQEAVCRACGGPGHVERNCYFIMRERGERSCNTNLHELSDLASPVGALVEMLSDRSRYPE